RLHQTRSPLAASQDGGGQNGVLVGRISPKDEGLLEALSKGKDRSPVMQRIQELESGWNDGGSKLLLKEPSCQCSFVRYISSEKWKDVTDVDDHLDDITKDWLNPGLFN
ncbi:hypothetical protein HID58_087904, partial [Brassica napus]